MNNVEIGEQLYYEYADKLLLHIKELVELENGIDFEENREVEIILTDDDMREFIDKLNKGTLCRKLYLGHDVLVSSNQEKMLARYGIQINIIPDYYYGELRG